MPLRVHSLIKIVALCAEMAIHIGIFALIASAMFAQKAGAYENLQFAMDTGVMFTVVTFMFFKDRHGDVEANRVLNVISFSIILLFSLTGAAGLTIRAASGSSFCEEFRSGGPGKCGEARLAIAISWTSVIIAIVGILVSWLDKHSGAADATYPPRRSYRKIELLRQQSTSGPANIPPRVHVARPPPSYAASRPQGPHRTQDHMRPAPAQTLPRDLQGFSPSRGHSFLLSPIPKDFNSSGPLMLNRTVNGSLGQTAKNPAFI